jgi:hypothetical protein
MPTRTVHLDTAICLNGHVMAAPDAMTCPICGRPTVTACSACHTPIGGGYIFNDRYLPHPGLPPAVCAQCRTPFPWTRL